MKKQVKILSGGNVHSLEAEINKRLDDLARYDREVASVQVVDMQSLECILGVIVYEDKAAPPEVIQGV